MYGRFWQIVYGSNNTVYVTLVRPPNVALRALQTSFVMNDISLQYHIRAARRPHILPPVRRFFRIQI